MLQRNNVFGCGLVTLQTASLNNIIPLIYYTFNAIIEINANTSYPDGMSAHQTHRASLTIRNLDPVIKERLRVRAAKQGHSMEAEARRILKATLQEPERSPVGNLYDRIRARFAPFGGVDELELPLREPGRAPPRFD